MNDPTLPAPGDPRPAVRAPLVLHVFPTFAVGGAQVRFAAVANRWGDRFRHAIVALDGRTECAARLTVPHRLPSFPRIAGESFPRRLIRIRTALRALAPDVLVTSNWGSIEWAIANLAPPRLRHVHTEDGFGPDEAQRQKRRRVLTRRLALRRSIVVLPSGVLLRAARDTWRLPEQGLRFVPNGIALARFHPDGPRADLAMPGEGPVIGTVAALRAEKNLGRLVRAVARLRRDGLPARLLIVGGGEERGPLEDLVRREGLEDVSVFAGALPHPAAAYRAMNVFALSSDTEQMPFSVLEAMATGLPVAATRVGDVPAMLSPENLPHVADLDDAALADALRPLLTDGALRGRIGSANRAKAERDYDEETMFAAYAELWERRDP